MKKLSCKTMGEDCDFVATGAMEKEVVFKMLEHVETRHPDVMEQFDLMPEAERVNLIDEMRMKMEET